MSDTDDAEAVRERRKGLFLTALETSYSVAAAARQAGMSRSAAYVYRHDDPDFAAAWDQAKEAHLDAIEASLMHRAAYGWEEPVYQNGMLVGTKQKYSDVACIFMLKKHRKEQYGDDPQPDNAAASDTSRSISDAVEAFAALGRALKDDSDPGVGET